MGMNTYGVRKESVLIFEWFLNFCIELALIQYGICNQRGALGCPYFFLSKSCYKAKLFVLCFSLPVVTRSRPTFTLYNIGIRHDVRDRSRLMDQPCEGGALWVTEGRKGHLDLVESPRPVQW